MEKYINENSIVSAILFTLWWVGVYYSVLDFIANWKDNVRPAFVIVFSAVFIIGACAMIVYTPQE